jgi:hypothetical protein
MCLGVWQAPGKVDLFAERDPHTHASTRRIVTRLYSMSAILPLERWVDGAVEAFISRIKKEDSETIDLGLWMQLLTFGEFILLLPQPPITDYTRYDRRNRIL